MLPIMAQLTPKITAFLELILANKAIVVAMPVRLADSWLPL